MDVAPQISPRCFAPELVLDSSGTSRTCVTQQGSVQVHPVVGSQPDLMKQGHPTVTEANSNQVSYI